MGAFKLKILLFNGKLIVISGGLSSPSFHMGKWSTLPAEPDTLYGVSPIPSSFASILA